MAERMNKTGVDAYAQFEKWLGEQPYWLQDAAYRIYHGLPIEQDQSRGEPVKTEYDESQGRCPG